MYFATIFAALLLCYVDSVHALKWGRTTTIVVASTCSVVAFLLLLLVIYFLVTRCCLSKYKFLLFCFTNFVLLAACSSLNIIVICGNLKTTISVVFDFIACI